MEGKPSGPSSAVVASVGRKRRFGLRPSGSSRWVMVMLVVVVLQLLKVSVFVSVTLRLPLRSCCAERIRFEYCCALNIELVENPACVAVATLSPFHSLS